MIYVGLRMKKHCFLPRPSVKVANEMHIAQPDKVLTHPNCLIQITKRKKGVQAKPVTQ